LPLGDLADRVRLTMPQDDPQTLSREQAADLVAALLRANHMPPGQMDLPAQTEPLRQIKYLAKKE
jgi:hypothetical protein